MLVPAQAVDPRIDEEREHEAVEGAPHDHARQERQHELDQLIGPPRG